LHYNVNLIRKISTGYIYAILLIGAAFSPPAYSVLAIVLLALNAYIFLKPSRPMLKLTVTFSTIVLAPLTLERITSPYIAGLASAPALPLLIESLRENPFEASKPLKGRRLTDQAKTLLLASAVPAFASAVLNLHPVAVSSLTALACLTATILYCIIRVPENPINSTCPLLRVLVGERAEAQVLLESKAGIRIKAKIFCNEGWAGIDPSEFSIKPDETIKIRVYMRPTLACPESLEVQLAAVDMWGLTVTGQTLKVLDVHVIPKARYAEWLAKRYIEGSNRTIGYTPISQIGLKPSHMGMEFHGCRLYVPGDNPRRIEWKHTSKLQRLIVKEYAGGFGRPSIVAGNMSVRNREEADETLFNLISSANTLAKEGSPIALAIYNREDIIQVTQPLNPEEALKNLLKLTGSVKISEGVRRVLKPVKIEWLSRLLKVLRSSGLAEGLLRLLEFEYMTLVRIGKNHPASKALKKSSSKTPPPAMLMLVSNWSHDAEALMVTLRELKKRGFEIIQPPKEQK